MPSLSGLSASVLDTTDTGDQRNKGPNLDLGSKREELEAEGLCHGPSRCSTGPLMSHLE